MCVVRDYAKKVVLVLDGVRVHLYKSRSRLQGRNKKRSVTFIENQAFLRLST